MFFYLRKGDRFVVCETISAALRYLADGWTGCTEAAHRAAWKARDDAIRGTPRSATGRRDAAMPASQLLEADTFFSV